MGAPSRRARKIRSAAEFDIARLRADLTFPRVSSSGMTWTIAEIVNARNMQMAGQFKLPARLAESMRTAVPLAVAYETRLAPQRCTKVSLVPAKGARGAGISGEAEALFGQDGVGISRDTLRDIHGCFVNHGVAFGLNVATPRDDGTRIDYALKYWPIEWVWWDAVYRCFRTQVEGGPIEEIHHGDGRWVVFRIGEVEPFKNGALLSASLTWARYAYALRDWAKSSVAHGSAKVIGEMPAGVALQKDGALTQEAEAMMGLLRDIASSDGPVGIRPAGSKTDFVANSSNNWQVFSELLLAMQKESARLYLGTDGTLGAAGGAPGVDISELFGVASILVEGDFRCIEHALDTGTIEPWTAINFGTSTLAPKRRYQLPDPDADAARGSLATRTKAFFDEMAASRSNGFDITQEYVDSLARNHGIAAPLLPPEAHKAPSIALAPTDIAQVVTVNEARASAGVGPLLLPDGTPETNGQLTVGQFAAKFNAPTSGA